MRNNKKVFIAASSYEYRRMFIRNGWDIANNPEEADLIQFTGGADVSPELYGDETHPFTSTNPTRDKAESYLYNLLVGKRPMAGICRGAQFLNVMNGGKMYQHVDAHCGSHTVMTDEGDSFIVTSTHHQMMRPSPEGIVKAYCGLSSVRESMKKGFRHITTGTHKDIEAIIYPKTKCLCYQPHPEFNEASEECTAYYFKLLEEIVL